MNSYIIKYFLQKGYLLFCPKTYNFGGFHESLLWALKIKKKKNLRIIINFIILNNHSHYNTFFSKIYGKKIIIKYLFSLSILEIILSLFFSFFCNLLVLLAKIKIISLLNLIFKKNIIKVKFGCIGFGLREINEIEIFPVIEINQILKTKVNLNNKNENYLKNKKIAFCVRDLNYMKFKDISSWAVADINTYKLSLIYLLNSGFEVNRIGDNSMKKFNLIHQNYFDLTLSKKHFDLAHREIKNSDFYFGTSASHGVMPDIYGNRKILTNNIDFVQSGTSASYQNFASFKKIYSIKKKKILSLEEIFFDKEIFFLNINYLIKNKEIILINNTPEEILNTLKTFLNYDLKKNYISKKMSEYEELRKKAIKHHKSKNIKNFYLSMYQNSKISIPDDFLNNYLYNSDKLREISRKFIIDNKL
jgi:putative glycosyltransferase (TIGR04372 family)